MRQCCISVGGKVLSREKEEALLIRINPLAAREQDLGKAVRKQHAHPGPMAAAFCHPGGQC